MTERQARPGPVRRLVPWVLAIIVGMGIGWLVGGLFAPVPEAGEADPAETRAAPPPVRAREQSAPAPPARALGPPITLSISNNDCRWGADFDAYYQQATAIMAQAGTQPGREMESVRVRVPARPWNGLTVTGIEAVHEGAGIIFAEPLPAVRAALERAGIAVAADGSLPFAGDADPGLAQSLRATSDSAVRYGATLLACGA